MPIETYQKIICGNNIPALQEMEDNSVDSIVTDAPYGLGAEPDPIEVMKDWVEKGFHTVKNKGGFMNKEWDAFVPQPKFWKEAFRVLKPGGHVLCFFGTRTYDWGVMAMRFAGFEIRDLVEYIYGTGFPKSLDISKAIDKAAGAERRVVSEKRTNSGGMAHISKTNAEHGFRPREYNGHSLEAEAKNIIQVTEATTEEAKEWEGWGTSLKPAHEPIVLARKPLSEKTVASNVLKHGTGGINIDACRIGEEVIKTQGGDKFKGDGIYGKYDSCEESYHQGRFPANLILDEFTAVELDKQSGVSRGAKNGMRRAGSEFGQGSGWNSHQNKDTIRIGHEDEGGASRFFYVAKPDVKEREHGLRHFEFKDPASVTDFRPTLKSNPENWANGTENPYTRTKQRKNVHPTVKPVSLMRYLVKMVTPKGGLCLDPYNGSGTTGMACKMEQINYIGIEQDEYSCKVSEARIASVEPEKIQQTLDIR